jgi:hypothetical protein
MVVDNDDPQPEGKDFRPLRASVSALENFHNTARAGKALSLIALQKTWASLAIDPKDKIFALLWLAADSDNLLPFPNYK